LWKSYSDRLEPRPDGYSLHPMQQQPDMFGHTAQQSEMFADEQATCDPPKKLTAEDIRQEMLALLAKARAAETMPWTPRALRTHTVLFPEMAKWLPPEEGEQLLMDFMTEIERLKKAA
jgi:hypothetical protein